MATEPNLTSEQRANLAKLADYLAALPADYEQFDMSSFHASGNRGQALITAKVGKPECGTVACAAGHGIAAGIPALPRDRNMWVDYSMRAFCPEGTAWDWCFDADWEETDNTASGAAARIRYLLSIGVPENYHEQIYGLEPLCYDAVSA